MVPTRGGQGGSPKSAEGIRRQDPGGGRASWAEPAAGHALGAVASAQAHGGAMPQPADAALFRAHRCDRPDASDPRSPRGSRCREVVRSRPTLSRPPRSAMPGSRAAAGPAGIALFRQCSRRLGPAAMAHPRSILAKVVATSMATASRSAAPARPRREQPEPRHRCPAHRIGCRPAGRCPARSPPNRGRRPRHRHRHRIKQSSDEFHAYSRR